MKLSVLLITGRSDRIALDTVENIASRSAGLTSDIFLIIAGDFTEEDRKKLYLERAAAFGMTAFINVGGKSSAELLNTFVKYANADYCTLMRAGGRTDTGYLPRLTAALDENSDVNIAFGRRMTSVQDPFTPSAMPAGITDYSKNSCCFPSNLEGTVVRTSYALAHPFDVEAGPFAETKGILSMLAECGKAYFDSRLSLWTADKSAPAKTKGDLPEAARTAAYHTAPFEKCILPLEESCKGKDGRLPLFLQQYVLSQVLARINEGLLLDDFPKDEQKPLTDTLTAALKPVEDKVICGVYDVRLPDCDLQKKRLLLGLKHGRERFYTDMNYDRATLYAVQKDIVLFDSSCLIIHIDLLNSRKNLLEIDGSFEDIFNERRTKLVAEYAGSEHTLTYDRKGEPTLLFGREVSRTRTFHLSLPVAEDYAELKFFLLYKGCRYEIKTSFSDTLHSRLTDEGNDSCFPVYGGICAVSEGGRLTTQPLLPKDIRRRFRESLSNAAAAGVPFLLRTAYRVTRPFFSGKNIWIFADDTEKGGGAAEDMFRYAMTRHDELYCYYLTDKDSPAAANLMADGYKPLIRGTLLHKLLWLNAQVCLTTKPHTEETNLGDLAAACRPLARNSRRNIVFLQNSPADIPTPAENSRLTDNVRLYFCGTGEYIDELRKPACGYENTDVLRLTGLTSYDDITDTSGEDKLILILAAYSADEAAPFTDTDFYKNCKALLENEAFTKALNESDYTLTLAFEGVTNDEADKLPKSEKVTLLTDEYDPDELISLASLVATDDPDELAPGFMRKPLVYFGCTGAHSFGKQADTPEALAELLCAFLKNEFPDKEELSQNADAYFGTAPLGCKREIYNTLITYLYENGEIDSYEDFEVADTYDDED
ncbi:hypothetical protein [Ruminococcus sp.]|uniref:hypothetical protein n=1 Tax=Ruminococcus sp. TaxID=41978 RepID=UPI0025D76E57|nr:hypothetical protein [Ruminococcus sp.]MBQ8965915.1 hypothetical protein [Ruminococcus sp.]